jgi:hypothetical protein
VSSKREASGGKTPLFVMSYGSEDDKKRLYEFIQVKADRANST